MLLTYNFLVTIAPLVSLSISPDQVIPHRNRFYAEGFTIFSEKGSVGKLCSEGLDSPQEAGIRRSVAESLCKSLGYE